MNQNSPCVQSNHVHTLISNYLKHYAQTTPNREAVVFGNQRLTYAELHTQVQQCAKALLAMYIKKGDRVAMLCTSRTEYWVVFLATTSIGAIWLGLNPKYRLQECRYVLEDARPTLLFAMAEFEGRCYQETIDTVQKDYGFVTQVIALTSPMPGTLSFSDFLASADTVSEQSLSASQSQVERLDPALLVYTSGSTGQPKGALLSHYGLCFGSTVQNQHFLVKQPRIICSFPINHAACVADSCCVNLVAGGTLVFHERFDPALVLQTINRERITVLGGVPTMLLMLLEHPAFESTDFSTLELIVWGGAALPVPVIKRLQALAPRLMNIYGMTETAANTTFTSPDADLIELSETIGRPSPHMPCRIINSEGQECSIGEHGELQFKGKYLLLEYLNRPDATKDVYTDDGWLHTGDLGYWREEGSISLVGRMSEMFKSGGYNVYPREIENCLENHPAVEMAAVVGVPDERFQEVGAAFMIITAGNVPDETALRDYCAANLANYKIPKTITFVKELPTLPVGKVDKVALKKQALESSLQA